MNLREQNKNLKSFTDASRIIGWIIIVIGILGMAINVYYMFFPNQYKIIAEGPKKIYSYKFNDKTILIHHIAGVVTNALVVKIGYLLLCFTSEASVLKTKSLINQLKFTIGYYFLCLTIGWLIS